MLFARQGLYVDWRSRKGPRKSLFDAVASPRSKKDEKQGSKRKKLELLFLSVVFCS